MKMQTFEAVVKHKAIHRQVLLIAATRADNTWKAYVHPVEGKSHEPEAAKAYEEGQGSALSESQARVFFNYPPFSDMKYSKNW
jgi:hypothetical protein